MSALQILRGGTRRTLWALGAAAALLVTAPASAQFGLSGGIADAFRPAYSTRDIQLAVDMLDLDDAQKFILDTLFEDYETEFETGVNAFKSRVAGMREELSPGGNPDPGQIMRVVFGTINEWREESRQLADQFTVDLKDLLNEEQLAAWPKFERKLFRLKYLKNGQLPGENLDLLNDVRDLDLDAGFQEQLQPVLEEYELRLDEALRRREEYMQQSQTELIDAIQIEDYELSIGVAERQAQFRMGVRDVNEQYAQTIAAALPDEASSIFVQRIRERTYPRVYRTTPTERAFAAALEIEDLDADVRTAIADLQTAYLAELEATNAHLAGLVRDFKPRELTHKVEAAAARLRGGETQPLKDPMRDEYSKRREMGDRYVEQMRALLTTEQFAALPGARRWLSPDERTATQSRSGAPGKGLVMPSPDGGVPRALSETDPATGAGERKDKADDDDGGN